MCSSRRRLALLAPVTILVITACQDATRPASPGAARLAQAPAPAGPAARYAPAMAEFGASSVVLFGGQSASGLLSDTWTWDGSRWTQRGPGLLSPSARVGATMAYDETRDRVVLFGGFDGTRALGDTWTWDGTSWTLVAVGALPPPRYAASMVYVVQRGRVQLYGGDDGSGRKLGDWWEWTGDAWALRLLRTAPSPRSGAGAARRVPGISTAVLFGGQGATGLIGATGPLGDTWLWHNFFNDWSDSVLVSPSPRYEHSMASFGNGLVVLFGGFDGTRALSDTWTWPCGSGPHCSKWSDWKLQAQEPGATPSARHGAGMARHAVTQRVVLFGGQGATGPLGDTWLWDGKNWKKPR